VGEGVNAVEVDADEEVVEDGEDKNWPGLIRRVKILYTNDLSLLNFSV